VRRFLVEVYAPAPRRAERTALARTALAAAATCPDVRLLGSLVLARDEVCLHVFEAPSRAALLRALDARRVQRERVVATVWIEPADLRLEPS
jgi:hypothetical protein